MTSDTLLHRAVCSPSEGPTRTSTPTPTNEPTLMHRAPGISAVEARRRASSRHSRGYSRVIQTRGTRTDQDETRLDQSTRVAKVDGRLEPIPTSDDPTQCTAVVEAEMTRVTMRIMATWSPYPTTETRSLPTTLVERTAPSATRCRLPVV